MRKGFRFEGAERITERQKRSIACCDGFDFAGAEDCAG
jgi:hypothetical protein